MRSDKVCNIYYMEIMAFDLDRQWYFCPVMTNLSRLGDSVFRAERNFQL